jgi:ABC-type histidine transport system ATPase subunit
MNRALALEPRIILMDEPTSALDPEIVGDMLAVLRDLRKSGITMVIASHEMRFAREAATKVLFLDGGLVVEEGDPGAIFGNPKEERTQRFLRNVLT